MKIQSIDATGLHIGHGTHEGMVGKNNEDAYNVLCYSNNDNRGPEKPFLLSVVADGVGGQSAGERASQLTIETIHHYFTQLESLRVDTVLQHINKAVSLANKQVFAEANQPDSPHEGMATTIVIAAIFDGLLFTSHIGDSRAYFLRDENLYAITKDHSWVQEAVDAGLLSPDQAKKHPNRNIIRRSIGTLPAVEVDQALESPWEPQFWQGMPLQHGDKILICSDGLNDMISDYQIKLSLVSSHDNVQSRVNEMITNANRAGGRDNITLVLSEVPSNYPVNKEWPIPAPPRPDTPPPPPLWKQNQQADPSTVKHFPSQQKTNLPKLSVEKKVIKSTLADTDYEQESDNHFRQALGWIIVAVVMLALIVLLLFNLQILTPPQGPATLPPTFEAQEGGLLPHLLTNWI